MSFQQKQGYGMYALGNMADLQLSSWYIAFKSWWVQTWLH